MDLEENERILFGKEDINVLLNNLDGENVKNVENVENLQNDIINNLDDENLQNDLVIESSLKEDDENKQNLQQNLQNIQNDLMVKNVLDENLLFTANRNLGLKEDLSKPQNKNIIFVYTPAKCGSTSLVSSLRLSCFGKFTVIHIHNDQMLHSMYKVDESIRVLDIIQFNQRLGKNVIVFDIFRTPIEQKMSLYFDLLGSYHFNRNKDAINKLSLNTVFNRFNKIYPHISYLDYFTNLFPISEKFETFDNEKGFLLSKDNFGVKYIKLRISDFNTKWISILQNILETKIWLVRDNTVNQFADLYKHFKANYQLPTNFLEDLKTFPTLDFYLTEEEKQDYLKTWEDNTSDVSFLPYTNEEYSLYCQIAKENKYLNTQQLNHYFDNGCDCIQCQEKRRKITRTNTLSNTNSIKLMKFY